MTRVSLTVVALGAVFAIACAGATYAAEQPAGAAAHPAHPVTGDLPAKKKAPPAKPVKRVDINKASRSELKTLPGVGDAEADKIIAGRPFLTKVDLITRGILPEGVYVSIKNQIVASQSGKPVQKK